MLRLATPDFLRFGQSETLTATYGGGEANVAVSLANFGIPVDYMLITGDHPDTTRGQFAGAPYSAAAQLVLALPSEISAVTESVGLNAATGALSMMLDGGTTVQLGDASNMDKKLARLLTHVRAGVVGVCEVDVSTAEVGIVPC